MDAGSPRMSGESSVRRRRLTGYRLQGLPRGPRRASWRRRSLSVTPSVRAPRVALGSGGEHRREHAALTLGHRPDRLLLRHRDLREELAAAGLAPAVLAHQEVAHRHAL